MHIDAHVHYLPPAVRDNLAELAEREPYWGLLLRPPTGHPIQAYATAEQMLADMDRAGLDQVVLVGEYYQRHESCVARNNQTIDLVQRYPERVRGLATVQPRAGALATAEVRRCLAYGLCGVGELNPYAQQFRLDSPEFEAIAALCEAEGVALNLHINEEVGPPYWGKSTLPVRHYYELACRHPALKLVLAHWGGGLLFYELMPRVRVRLAQVVYDTAASPLLYPTAEIFTTALTCVPPHKLLYGSDYPLRLYPRTQREADFRPFLAEIAALSLPPEVEAAVMGGNAQRVYAKGGEAIPAPPPLAGDVSLSRLSIPFLLRAYPESEPLLARAGLLGGAEGEPWEQVAAVRGLPFSQTAALREALAELIKER